MLRSRTISSFYLLSVFRVDNCQIGAARKQGSLAAFVSTCKRVLVRRFTKSMTNGFIALPYIAGFHMTSLNFRLQNY